MAAFQVPHLRCRPYGRFIRPHFRYLLLRHVNDQLRARCNRMAKGYEWREVGQGWRDNLERLRKIERVDRMWTWLERMRGKNEIAEVDDEAELERLNSGEGEGSVGGETLFEGEENENGKSTSGMDGQK